MTTLEGGFRLRNGIGDYFPPSIFFFSSASASISPRVDLSSLFEEEEETFPDLLELSLIHI